MSEEIFLTVTAVPPAPRNDTLLIRDAKGIVSERIGDILTGIPVPSGAVVIDCSLDPRPFDLLTGDFTMVIGGGQEGNEA